MFLLYSISNQLLHSRRPVIVKMFTSLDALAMTADVSHSVVMAMLLLASAGREAS